jgi:hypothetical protein
LREIDAMILDPSSYECPEHHADLTDLLEETLRDDDPPVAYFPLRKTMSVRPFRVVVTCPGAIGAGAHQLTCSGIRTQ